MTKPLQVMSGEELMDMDYKPIKFVVKEFLTKKGIENIRSAFAHEIFHDEFYHIYKQKDELRKCIREDCKQLLAQFLAMKKPKKNTYLAGLLFFASCK